MPASANMEHPYLKPEESIARLETTTYYTPSSTFKKDVLIDSCPRFTLTVEVNCVISAMTDGH